MNISPAVARGCCPVGSIGDGGSIGGAGRLLLRCHGRAQRAEHPTLHAGRGSVGRELALSSLYRPSPPRNPSLASVSCREWRVRRAVGGSAAEPSAPSDDTLHLDRPAQLAGFQIAHGIAAPQPGVLHQLREVNPRATAINPPETAGSRPAARCTRQEGLEEKAPPAARPAARATSHDRATRPTLVAPSAPRQGWMVKSARQMETTWSLSINTCFSLSLLTLSHCCIWRFWQASRTQPRGGCSISEHPSMLGQ